jgi:hypothetical protein
MCGHSNGIISQNMYRDKEIGRNGWAHIHDGYLADKKRYTICISLVAMHYVNLTLFFNQTK